MNDGYWGISHPRCIGFTLYMERQMPLVQEPMTIDQQASLAGYDAWMERVFKEMDIDLEKMKIVREFDKKQFDGRSRI